jgi:hypothetical protein
MVVGMIKVSTCYGDVDIPVEITGKGPRPGTAWVKALNGLQPFTKFSHGGPYQDDTAVVLTPNIRDIHQEPDLVEGNSEQRLEKPVIETPILVPERFIPAEDWFLESSYEDRTCIE